MNIGEQNINADQSVDLQQIFSYCDYQMDQINEQLHETSYFQQQQRSYPKKSNLEDISLKVSGIHQKYLSKKFNLSSLKECSEMKSEPKLRKIRSITYSKDDSQISSNKSQQSIKSTSSKNEVRLIDPLTFEQHHLQIQNKTDYIEKIQNLRSENSENRNQMFSNFGLKPPKTLGKGKTQRQISNFLQYLQNGTIPEEMLAA